MKKPGIIEGTALLTTIFFFGAMNGGSLFAFLFLYLAPLPLFILGLKKDSPWCGLVGAVAAVSLYFITTPQMSIMYLLAIAGPTTFFCEKATSRAGPSLDGWYSISNLCLFIIVPPTFLFVLLTAYFWLYGQGLGFVLIEKTNEIFDLYITALKGQGQNINPSISLQLKDVKKSFSDTAPALIAIFWMSLIVLNGLIAQSILRKLKQNQRPSFAIREVQIPRLFVVTLLSSITLAIFLNGELGYLVTNLTPILAFPVMLAGLGVVHMLADKTKYNGSILFFLYLIITFSRWAAILVVLVGIADHFLKLRNKVQADNLQ
tara:strand:+ start:489 stop:1442 length:954 start_codon:yes stop_codon:yes gene_type:complete